MKLFRNLLVPALSLAAVASVRAAPLDQWAGSVLGFTSEFSATNWGSIQALGAPDVPAYGDNPKAWAPSSPSGTKESISLGYATSVYAYGATIRETLGTGFVYKVDVRDTGGVWHTVWTGTDPSKPGTLANFFLAWPSTTYRVNGVRVHVDTDATPSAWDEIDAVQLHGYDVNQPAVKISAPDNVASESFSSTAVFEITRELGAITGPLAVNYQITGTAGNGVDYNESLPLSGSVTIPSGKRSVALVITPVDDAVKEKSETVIATLVAGPGYQIAGKLKAATVTINSNE
ncbi:hypothetical protein [Methylotetracoccus oryzae]|uniref:hypothetical protein n=1 Tax=Methylotetracoccus oryzae TaxID=1919059 RepID=UPI001118996F|nr:hypothetical protein [Methylotetracoccus oryzae]